MSDTEHNNSDLVERIAALKDSPYTYATFMETNEEECESWYTFIRYQGNEEVLQDLNDQLESIGEMELLEGKSIFFVELEYLVSEHTAKEMTRIDMGVFNRKFDGKMRRVNFNLLSSEKRKKKLKKVFNVLGNGKIENFVEDEDVEDNDLETDSSDSESGSDSSVGSSDHEEEDKRPVKRGVPPALLKSELPRFAKAKGRRQHRQ